MTFFREGKLRWVVLAIALALVVVIVVVLTVTGQQRGEPDADASADPSNSSSPPPESAAPSSSPSPSPSDSTAEPVEPGTEAGPGPQPTKAPVGFDEEAEVNPALSVVVSDLEAVAGEAQGAGEIAAPSIRVTLTITNSTPDEVDLSTAVTTVSYGPDGVPAQELSGPGRVTLPTEIAGNSSATAVLVFSVPPEERNLVRILFDYSVDVPLVLFQGAAPQ